jgi:hypothetical protein
MISAVTSNLSSAGNSVSSRIAKIDALNKHASTLREQLAQEQQPGVVPQDSTKSNSLTQELVTIQSQIERLVLDSQLSKLTAQDESSDAASHGGTPGAQKSDDKAPHGEARGGKHQDLYHVAKTSGNLVDVQA